MEERAAIRRKRPLKLALQVETWSLLWIVTETVLSAVAAVSAGSLAMSAFSVDSAVELVSGVVLLLRLMTEYWTGKDQLSDMVERIAAGTVGSCLLLLAAYISFKSGQQLAAKTPVEVSTLGAVVAAVSSLLTPWLASLKHRLGVKLHSHALLGDAACSMTCAYMAWTLLAGLAVQWAFGWWWMDAVAALGIVYFVLREALESWTSALTGEAHVH
jgi:divalent metal cation (Fe/Co/Zn/Cd) transporter